MTVLATRGWAAALARRRLLVGLTEEEFGLRTLGWADDTTALGVDPAGTVWTGTEAAARRQVAS